MKTVTKVMIALGAIALIAGAAIGCSKMDNTTSNVANPPQSKSKIPSYVTVGYSESSKSDIVLMGNKDSIMAELETSVQSVYGSDMVVEDVDAYHLDSIAVLKVTLFDTKDGGTYTSFAPLDKLYVATKAAPGQIGGYYYHLHYEAIYESITCYAYNCGDNGCVAVNTEKGLACTACPSGNCSWDYVMARCVIEFTFLAIWMLC